MRRSGWVGVLLGVTGCATQTAAVPQATTAQLAVGPVSDATSNATPASASTSTSTPTPTPAPSPDSDHAPDPTGAWIGAAAESGVMLRGSTDTAVGVWVDAPSRTSAHHVPVDVALVVDTSGSMSGEKIEGARAAAKALVRALHDGDVVTIDTFSDHARPLVAAVRIDADSRVSIAAHLDGLVASGGTNMYEGLALAEEHAARADADHPVRRVVMISDGIATVGITSPASLGELAERGLRAAGVQVTSLGVGVDYDERTLDALAVRTSGRLYHLGDPRAMDRALEEELALLGDTVANGAFVEVAPAPGVRVLGADGVAVQWGESGAIRIPLGALHAGQHREALVRVRVDASWPGGARSLPGSFRPVDERDARPLASVRLRFRDPSDGDVERVQEIVARAGVTDDANLVAASANAKTQAIAAIQSAAKMELEASSAVSRGDFHAADAQLARAQAAVVAQAAATKDDKEKKRLTATASSLGAARASAGAAAAAPAPMQREEALKMNHAAMSDLGY